MPGIWSLVSATEHEALFVVDKENKSLKRVNLSSGAVDVLYRSPGNYSLRGAAFVADAQNRMHSLLLAEMQLKAIDNTMLFSVVVAELRDTAWTPTQRIALNNAPSAEEWCVSICAVQTNRVLCGVCGSSTLDVLAVTSAREARKEALIQLGFVHTYFTCGVCDKTTLLFVKELNFAVVRILELTDGAPHALQLLRRIEGSGALWCNNGLLFLCIWSTQFYTAEVCVWRVSHGGRCVERLNETPITHADNLFINRWCCFADKIALYDKRSGDIVLYSYELKTK